ncbi:MAG: hypothetical protein ACR2OZ_12425 [Verrucomicrobiales bacterium]
MTEKIAVSSAIFRRRQSLNKQTLTCCDPVCVLSCECHAMIVVTLNQFQIIAHAGAGGMGEVLYRSKLFITISLPTLSQTG